MPLHPAIARALAAAPAPPPGPLDPVALRRAEAVAEPHRGPEPGIASVVDASVPGPGRDVPVRLYTPAAQPPNGSIVYCHGGAFFLGSLDTHDHMARALVLTTGCSVISVGYRLAPEAAFPAGLDDCYAALRWAADRRPGDSGILAMAGDSSGGALAAAICARALDDGLGAVTHQVLYYPSLDLDVDEDRYPSLRENAEGYGITTASLRPFNSFYLSSGADPLDPRVSPIRRDDLTGLPPALVVTAEFDPLRDEAELYGRRLRDAGVYTTVLRVAGATHGFLQHFGAVPEFADIYRQTALFLGVGEETR